MVYVQGRIKNLRGPMQFTTPETPVDAYKMMITQAHFENIQLNSRVVFVVKLNVHHYLHVSFANDYK